MPSLSALADRLDRSPPVRHAFLAGLTLAAVLLIGYHFGTFDQAIHIAFLKRSADPTLFPGDAFLELRHLHYSFFWYAFVPLQWLGLLEPALFAVHLFATYATLWIVWRLGRQLFADPLAATLACLALAVPHVGFAGFPVIEFSLLNRTFALPFLLLAMAWYLEGRARAAFALVGALFNVHALSASFVLTMLLLDTTVRWRAVGVRSIAVGLGRFCLAAAPVLAWRLLLPRQAGALSLQPAWFDVVGRSLLYNVFHFVGPASYVGLLTACGLGAFGLFAVARRHLPPGPHDRTVTHFMLAITGIVALEIVVANGWPVTLLVQLQIVRAGVFALVFGYLFFGAHLAARVRSGAGAVPVAAFVGLTPPFAPLAIDAVSRIAGPRAARRLIEVAALLAFGWVTLHLGRSYGIWSPGLHVYAPRTPWVDVQLWARAHAPKDALFITPPHIYWLYTPDWRTHSERSTVATLSEVLEFAFDPEYLAVWQPRFEAVAPGTLARFRGDVFENRRLIAAAYDGLTDVALRRVAACFGADYLVVQRPRLRGLPVAYANEGFTVYDVR